MAYNTAVNSVIITADLVLANKASGATQTIKISSSNIELFETTTFSERYPILKNIKGLTQEHNQFLPLSTSAQMTLVNSEGSFGFERRFADLLETHTVTEQDCTVTINLKTDNATTASFTESLVYKMQGTDIDLESGDILINLKNNPISEKVITKEITTDDFPNVYTSSIGRFLPLVLGSDVNVLCEKLGSATYGYATNFGSSYQCGTPDNYYIKARNGEYQEIGFAATTSTAIDYNPIGSSTGLFWNLGQPASAATSTGGGVGFELQGFSNNQNGYLVDRGRFYAKVQAGGASSISGNLIIELVEGQFNTTENFIKDYSIIATAAIDKNDFTTEYNATTTQWFDFTFDEPAIIGKAQNENLKYWLLISDNKSQEGYTQLVSYNLASGSNDVLTRSSKDNQFNAWDTPAVSEQTARFELYGATVTDASSTTEDDNGLAYHAFTIDTGTNDNNLSKYSFGVTLDGLGDVDTDAPTIIKNLLTETGNNYLDAGFDNDWTASQTAYPRIISGALLGKVQLTTALRELCQNSGCRIFNVTGYSGSKGVDIFSWGTELSSAFSFLSSDIKTNAIKISDRTSVINNITANYKINPITANDEEYLRQGIISSFTRVLSNYSLDSVSKSIYGLNNLTDTRFQLIGDATTMQNVAEYYLRSFNNPSIIIEFSFPYLPRKFIPGRVIEILSPKLPAYYGSSTNPIPAINSNGEIVIVNDGIDQVRAKRYRGIIEGKSTEMNENGQVFIVLRVRALISSIDPT